MAQALSQRRGRDVSAVTPESDGLRRDCMQKLLTQKPNFPKEKRREEKLDQCHNELQSWGQFSQGFVFTTVYADFPAKVHLLHVQGPVTKNPTLG